MCRRIVTALMAGAALIGLLVATVGAQEAAPVSRTRISGGNLPHSVLLTVVDEDAFVRRLDLPPILEQPPSPKGPVYTVTSAYWATVLKDADVEAGAGELDASYYPELGYARVLMSGEEFWLVLNQRQRAILNRYIDLTTAGSLKQEPHILEVLIETSKLELVTVQIGGRFLDKAETAQFWRVSDGLARLAGSEVPDQAEAETAEDILWIFFNLPEGRAIQMRYFVAEGLLVDSLGAEAFRVPVGWLADILGAHAPRPGETLAVGGRVIEQDAGRGSPLWWVVMGFGGLTAIGAAIWLRRRWAG